MTTFSVFSCNSFFIYYIYFCYLTMTNCNVWLTLLLCFYIQSFCLSLLTLIFYFTFWCYQLCHGEDRTIISKYAALWNLGLFIQNVNKHLVEKYSGTWIQMTKDGSSDSARHQSHDICPHISQIVLKIFW
jgi:hypothetical protein